MSFDAFDEGGGSSDLARLIDRALALADTLDLSLVALSLSEARATLGGTQHDPDTTFWFEDGQRSEPRGALGPGPDKRRVVSLRPQASLEQLLADHYQLDAMRQALMTLVAGMPAPLEAAGRLAAFRAVMERHRAVERSCVYGPLLHAEMCHNTELGFNLHDLSCEIDDHWSAYFRDWDAAAMARDWPAFRRETIGLLARAGERLCLENDIIYPMAFRHGIIQRGAGAA